MSIFLNASILKEKECDDIFRTTVQQEKIEFDFPQGFTQLRLIEECRALNALDMSNSDNFDFMYDITMQMLTGKIVSISLKEDSLKKEIARFVVTDRYMNLRGIDVIDEYPIIVNWLVEFIAGYLGKKYPRSFKNFQATMSERREHTKSLKSEEVQVTASFQYR